MLSYAFTILGQGDYEEIATEDFENMHNLFAAILSKGINRQLKQGYIVNTSTIKKTLWLPAKKSTRQEPYETN